MAAPAGKGGDRAVTEQNRIRLTRFASAAG